MELFLIKIENTQPLIYEKITFNFDFIFSFSKFLFVWSSCKKADVKILTESEAVS